MRTPITRHVLRRRNSEALADGESGNVSTLSTTQSRSACGSESGMVNRATDSSGSLNARKRSAATLPAGNPMIVYTATDDTGFSYLAEIPVDQAPKNLTKDMSMGKSPDGKALKFVHRGSYDNMDNTYEAITNHLDDKKLEAKDTFVEEYMTDPLTTAEDKLVINVYVPLK